MTKQLAEAMRFLIAPGGEENDVADGDSGRSSRDIF